MAAVRDKIVRNAGKNIPQVNQGIGPQGHGDLRARHLMIIYLSTKAGFLDDAFGHDIGARCSRRLSGPTGRRVAASEVRSWKESPLAMAKVLRHDSIPDDCGIAIEYVIPQTAKRIDLLMSGLDEQARSTLIIIELKQWETAARTDRVGWSDPVRAWRRRHESSFLSGLVLLGAAA